MQVGEGRMDRGVAPKTDRKEEEEMEEKRYYWLEGEGHQTSVDNGKRGSKWYKYREKGNFGNLGVFCVFVESKIQILNFLYCVWMQSVCE